MSSELFVIVAVRGSGNKSVATWADSMEWAREAADWILGHKALDSGEMLNQFSADSPCLVTRAEIVKVDSLSLSEYLSTIVEMDVEEENKYFLSLPRKIVGAVWL